MRRAFTRAAAITPHDSNVVMAPHDALWVSHASGAADVAVAMVGGGTVTFGAVPSGTLLPCKVRQVLATGTTAGVIVIALSGN